MAAYQQIAFQTKDPRKIVALRVLNQQLRVIQKIPGFGASFVKGFQRGFQQAISRPRV